MSLAKQTAAAERPIRRIALNWDVDDIAAALQIEPHQVALEWADGRVAWALARRRVENWLAFIGLSARLVVLTNRGATLAPSSMIGTGRDYNPARFLGYLAELDRYAILDGFPTSSLWVVPVEVVQRWTHSPRGASIVRSGRVTAADLRALLLAEEVAL